MKKILVYFLSIFLISFNSYAIPVGGITKFFKGLFSKGDEMIDAGSTVGKSSDEAANSAIEFNKFIDPETYKGQSFEDIVEEISAMNAEPLEGLKKYYDPSENAASAMSNDDYSLWLEYYTARGAGKSLQQNDESEENKIKTCSYLNQTYKFLEVNTGELILISINNRMIKTVLNEVYANESFRQYTYFDKKKVYQFFFFDDDKFMTNNDMKVFVNLTPSGMIERCQI